MTILCHEKLCAAVTTTRRLIFTPYFPFTLPLCPALHTHTSGFHLLLKILFTSNSFLI